uniref:Uncharacterized protein n=1 Tax=Rhabditophanes sp. KR3021 TaxID=114890 RepID=A0AC35TH46_9BILA
MTYYKLSAFDHKVIFIFLIGSAIFIDASASPLNEEQSSKEVSEGGFENMQESPLLLDENTISEEDKQFVPITIKRAKLRYSGGLYGKRGLRYSGGLYGRKRRSSPAFLIVPYPDKKYFEQMKSNEIMDQSDYPSSQLNESEIDGSSRLRRALLFKRTPKRINHRAIPRNGGLFGKK